MRHILATAALAALLAAPQARAGRMRTIDFDADLRTMLIDLDSLHREGSTVTLWELQVEGRTSALRGDYAHQRIQRRFDCAAGTEVVLQVVAYAGRTAAPRALPLPAARFTPRAGSIDAAEQALACGGPSPAATYPSEDAAVAGAFADAVKLPAAQSNRTTQGPMGPPP